MGVFATKMVIALIAAVLSGGPLKGRDEFGTKSYLSMSFHAMIFHN